MLIPVRCMTCGSVIADKWNAYERECKKLEDMPLTKEQEQKGKELKNMEKKTRGDILDRLEVKRLCCRRMFIGCVDMMELI
jgi:DNA-directed RNA polymerase subunit N (RpoN/RPB10)